MKILLLLTLISKISAELDSYEGCFKEDPNDREFSVAGADLGYDQAEPLLCTALCKSMSFAYAALQEGYLCMCSDSVGKHSNGSQSGCIYRCSGDQVSMCGGPSFGSVYSTATAVKDFAISDPGFLEVFQPSDILITLGHGTDGSFYAFDFGDTSGKTSTMSEPCPHIYVEVNVYLVFAWAWNHVSGPLEARREVFVEAPISDLSTTCNPYVEVGHLFTCVGEVGQGTSLEATWNFNDETDTATMNVGDAQRFIVGDFLQRNLSSMEPSFDVHGVYILPYLEVKQEGKLEAWEVYAVKEGQILLQVFRPLCDAREKYCAFNRTCINRYWPCPPAGEKSCRNDTAFCIEKGSCQAFTEEHIYQEAEVPVNISCPQNNQTLSNITTFGNNTILGNVTLGAGGNATENITHSSCNQTTTNYWFNYSYSFGECLDIDSYHEFFFPYKLVGSNLVYLKEGYNIFAIKDVERISLQPHDVLGFTPYQQKFPVYYPKAAYPMIGEVAYSLNTMQHFFFVEKPLLAEQDEHYTNEYQKSVGSFYLRAHMSRKTRTWIQHSFTKSGMFTVNVEFNNRLGSIVEGPSKRIASQYRILSIEGLDFTRNLGIYYACTDVSYPMKVEITQGTFVRFQWFFPNDSVIVSAPYLTNDIVDKPEAKTPDSQSYHFDEIGNYTTVVKAYNNISTQYVTLFTIARYRILGLNGSIDLYPGDNTTKDWNLVLSGCWFNFSSLITSGNVVEYIWDYGDGQGSGDWKPDTTYSHYYSNPGTYMVSIRSDNIASVLDHTFKVTAEKPNYVEIPEYGTSDIPVLMFCRVTWHSGEGLEFHWDFGDDSNATVFDTGIIYHNYTTYGVYEVCCMIKNYPLVTDTKSIIVQDPVEGVVLHNKTDVLATTDDVGYIVTITRGNDVKYDWFYGDQVADDTTLEPNTEHVYNIPNYFFVRVNVSNVVSWMMSKDIEVELQERVTNTQVACEDNMVYKVVEITVTTESGNKIWYHYDFGDGHHINSTNSTIVTHVYIEPEIYTISVTAYNSVSSVVGTRPIQIDTVIEASFVDAATPHVRALSLDCKCTAIKGSSVLMTFDWGDGSTDGPFIGDFDGIDSYYTSSHTYATEGTFNITCFIENPWSNSVNSTFVIVQEAIVELEFEPSVAVKGNIFNFTVLPFVGDSHDVLLEWDYGDGLRYTTTEFKHQYVYRDAGKYSVVLMASNLVSRFSVTQELYTQEHVIGLMFLHDVMPVTPGNSTIVSWSIEYGTDVEYKVNLGDGEEQIILQTDVGNSYTIHYPYKHPGSYNVTVKASNMLNSHLISTLAHVEYPIKGLAAYIQGNSTIHTDKSALIKIIIEQGTNVEYTCDYHDGSAPIVTTKLFCKHMFIELGPHVVTVYAANHLSSSIVAANETYTVLLPPIPQMIQDLGIHSDDAVIVDNPIFFYLEKTRGNMFNCTWDFGDGSTFIIDPTMYYTPVVHRYEEVDEYDVLLNCSNLIYPPVQAYKHIHVQEPITGLNFNVTPVIEYGMDFMVNFTIETGTDVASTIIYAGMVFQAYIDDGSGFGVIASRFINQSGWVEITITAENMVTEKLFLTKKLYVQNRVTGLKFWADPPYVVVGTIVTCHVSLETGTNVTFEWHFGTNYVVETHLNESLGLLTDSRTHFYSQVGLYAMFVVARNHFNEFTSTPVLVAVQNKIHGFSISTNDRKVEYPNGTVVIDMQWNTYFKTLPTNATLTIDFGDGSNLYVAILDDIPQISVLRKTSTDCSDATLPNFESQCQIDESLATENTKETIVTVQHSFTPGIYTVVGRVYNLATEQVVTITIQTEEPIVGCAINTFFIDEMENQRPGGGPASNYFPIEYPVVFSANHTKGTGLRYGWRFGDGVVLFTNDFHTPHLYNSARGYTIRLYSSNIFGALECSTGIHVQKAVIGLFLAHSGPTPENQPITVILFVSQAGTSATYILDVPDEVNMSYYMKTPVSDYGAIQEALELMDSNIFLPFDPFTHAVSTVNLTFNSSSNYIIEVIGFNYASSASATTSLPITEEPCQLPKVIILGGSKNSSEPLTIRKRFNFILSSDIKIFCQETMFVTIKWSVYVLEFFNEEPLPVDSLMQFPLPENILVDQAQLVLPRGVLDYGSYIIQLTVTMDNKAKVMNSNHTYLQVLPSSLVAHLSGGHYVTLSRNESLILNASLSRDPDVINITRSSDVLEDLRINHPSDPDLRMIWSCRLLKSGDSCFKEGHHGLVDGVLIQNVSTFDLILSDVLIFSINVSKVGRKSVSFEQEVTLINGNIPIMDIICIENCKYKVSPSSRLVLRAMCQNCGNNTDDIQYHWYMPLTGPLSGNITDTTSKYFVVPSSTLLAQVGESLLVYLGVNQGNSFATGRADYDVKVGLLPLTGTCSIIPKSGISYETSFSIDCIGYSSDELPLSYQFLYNSGLTKTPSSLYNLIYHSPESSTSFFTLPAGEENDNMVQILVKVTDAIGAVVEQTLQVQVLASNPEVIESELLALTSNGSTTLLNKLIAKGDTQASVKYIGDIAVMLNQVSKQHDATWDNQLNQELRSKLLEGVDNVILQTVEGLKQTSSVLPQIINEPDELTFDIQMKSSEKYTDMLRLLETDLSDQLDEENVLSISTNFFQGASNLLKAASHLSIDYYNQLRTDPEAWNEYFADTDTAQDDKSQKDTSMLGIVQARLADDLKAAVEKHQSSEHIPDDLEKSRNVTKKMLAFLDGVSNLILTHKVPGEEAVLLQTDHMSLLLKREDLHSMSLRFYMNPDGSWFKVPEDVLSEIHALHGDELMVQVMSTPQNPYTWHASGYEVRTSIVSLIMKNLAGETLAIADLKSKVEMLIPRGDSSAIEFETLSTAPDELLFVNFNITEMYSSIHIDIVPTDPTTKFTAYLRFGFRPTTRLYDLQIEMPLPSHSLYESIFNDTANITTNPFTWYIAENELFSFGSYYLAVKPKPVKRDKYAVLAGNDSYADDPRKQVDFDIKVYNARCLFWSEMYEQWFPQGCEVGTLTTPSFTHCLCNHLTAFGGSFFVAEKKQIYHIEETITIVVIEESQLMYYVLGGIIGLFLLLLMLALRLDKQIEDKMFGDHQIGPYNYLLTIFTGNEIDAGTTSEIYVMLSNDSHPSSSLYHLSNADNLSFKQGSIDAYVMSTPKPLNNITSLTVCLDGRGYTPSWHLSHACIQDCWTGIRYFIFCNCWMSKNSHPQTFKVACNRELSGKLHLFDTDEIHHGFWSYWRTVGSSLTLAEIVLSWLVGVMTTISCCIFFHEFLGWEIEVDGQFTISISSIIYGLQAGLMSLPVRLIFIQLFSCIRLRLASYTTDREEPKAKRHKKYPQKELSLEDVKLEENNRSKVEEVASGSNFNTLAEPDKSSFQDNQDSAHSTVILMDSETSTEDGISVTNSGFTRRWSRLRHHSTKKIVTGVHSESSFMTATFPSTTSAFSKSSLSLNFNQNANPQQSLDDDVACGSGDNLCVKELFSKNLQKQQININDIKQLDSNVKPDLKESHFECNHERIENVEFIRKNSKTTFDSDGKSSCSDTMDDLDSGVVSESEEYQHSNFARRFHKFFLKNKSVECMGTVDEFVPKEIELNYNNNAKGNTEKKKDKTIEKSTKNKNRGGKPETKRTQKAGKEKMTKNLWKQKQMMHEMLEQKRMYTESPSCLTVLLEKICRSGHKRSLPWFVAIGLWLFALCLVGGLGFFSVYFSLAYPDIVVMNLTVALTSALIINMLRIPIQWVLTAFLGSIFWKRLSLSNTRYIIPRLPKIRNLRAFKQFHKFKHNAVDSKIYGSMNYHPKPVTKTMEKCKMFVKITARVFLTTLVFLLILISNDPSAYYMKKATENMFVSGYETNSVSFLKVKKGDDFFKWSKQTFYPAASLIIDRSASYDHLRFLGSPRFRQFRVQRSLQDSCRNMNVTTLVHSLCALPFSPATEDQTEHFNSWSEAATSGSQLPGYNYITPEESSGGIMYHGKYASYSSAGYTTELGPSSERVLGIIENLKSSKWIDQFTRAVFVEFAVINLYTGTVCLVTLVMEISPGGIGDPAANYATFKYSISDMHQYILMLLAALSLIFLVVMLRSMKREGRAFYQKLINLGNTLFVCLSLATTMISYTYTEAWKSLSPTDVDVAKLQELAQQQQLANSLATLLLMLTTLLLLDVFNCIPHFEHLTTIFSKVFRKVLLAQPILIMMMALFVILGKVLYGSVLEPFSYWWQGLQLLFRVLLGGPREGTPENLTLPYFFIVHVIMTRLSILLVFVTIIIRTYSARKLRLALDNFVESGVMSNAICKIQRTYNTQETLEKVQFRKALVARKWRLWRNQQDLTKLVLNKSKRMVQKTNSMMSDVMSEHKALFSDPVALVDEALRQVHQRQNTPH